MSTEWLRNSSVKSRRQLEQKLLIATNSLENAHVSIGDIWSAVTGHRFRWRGGLTPQSVDESIQARLRQVAAD